MSTEAQRAYQRDWYQKNREARRVAGRANMKAWREKNPDGAREANRKWRAKNPGHLKDYLLQKTYGISLKQKEDLFIEQDCRCAICRSPTTAGRGWHVDHSHSTKSVRGILCNHCNLMIGHAKENTDVLASAIEYLQRGIKR